MNDDTLNGAVIRKDGQYFVVECPNAPSHLRSLNLVRGQMRGADVGDRVTLMYFSTPHAGMWSVVTVEPRPNVTVERVNDDWIRVYVNGKLIAENHTLSIGGPEFGDILRAIDPTILVEDRETTEE